MYCVCSKSCQSTNHLPALVLSSHRIDPDEMAQKKTHDDNSGASGQRHGVNGYQSITILAVYIARSALNATYLSLCLINAT